MLITASDQEVSVTHCGGQVWIALVRRRPDFAVYGPTAASRDEALYALARTIGEDIVDEGTGRVYDAAPPA